MSDHCAAHEVPGAPDCHCGSSSSKTLVVGARRNGVTTLPGTKPRLLSRLMMGALAVSSTRPTTRPVAPRRRSERELSAGGGVPVVPVEADVLCCETAVVMMSSNIVGVPQSPVPSSVSMRKRRIVHASLR